MTAALYGLILLALLGFLLRYWRGTASATLALVAGSPFLMLTAPVALAAALHSRRWITGAVALGVAVVCSVSQFPAYVAADPPAHGVPVVAMTANLHLGYADATTVVSEVRSHHVDLLMVEELTQREFAALQAAGLDQALPYSSAHPSYAADGTGLWSRYPMTDIGQLDGLLFTSAVATVAVPGAARPVRVVALHVAGPVPQATYWRADMRALPGQLRAVAAANDGGPVLVGGDFNATPQSPWFRNVLAAGYADGTRQAGEGMVPTYPADDRLLPPVLPIDHVLTHGGPVATSARSISIPGSDHRALLVGLSVPAR